MKSVTLTVNFNFQIPDNMTEEQIDELFLILDTKSIILGSLIGEKVSANFEDFETVNVMVNEPMSD